MGRGLAMHPFGTFFFQRQRQALGFIITLTKWLQLVVRKLFWNPLWMTYSDWLYSLMEKNHGPLTKHGC